MSAHQIVGDQITNSLVEFRRTFEVGKQKGETRNLEPLIHVERVGAMNVAECLVSQKTFRSQEGTTLVDEFVNLSLTIQIAGNVRVLDRFS